MDDLLDYNKIKNYLLAIKNNIIHKNLKRVSPMSIPLLLEFNIEKVKEDNLIDELKKKTILLLKQIYINVSLVWKQSIFTKPDGSMYWIEEKSLIVGDLHLEKSTSYIGQGNFLPPYDTIDTLEKLLNITKELSPNRIIFLVMFFTITQHLIG